MKPSLSAARLVLHFQGLLRNLANQEMDFIMAEYIYLPVPTPEMTEMATEFSNQRVKGNLPAPGILRNYYASGAMKGVHRWFGFGCLKSVNENDTLFLILHGAGRAGSSEVGCQRGLVAGYKRGVPSWVEPQSGAVTWKKYTTDGIATVLEAESLPKSFVDLHILTCGGGLEGGDKPALATSFAERVFHALKAKGYNHIEVTGYLGDVVPGVNDGFAVDVKIGRGTSREDASWKRTIR